MIVPYTKRLRQAIPHGGAFLYKIVHLIEESPEETDVCLVEAIIEMDKYITELNEELIRAKQRALPDDFIEGNKRITFSVEEHRHDS